MFSFCSQSKNVQNEDLSAAVQGVTADKEPEKPSDCEMQNTPLQDIPDNTIHTLNLFNDTNDPGNLPPITEEAASDTDKLLSQVNDRLERELKETKKVVKRIFKEVLAFHKFAKKRNAEFAPIQEAEHQESLRLDTLQAEVESTIGTLPGVHQDFQIHPKKHFKFPKHMKP